MQLVDVENSAGQHRHVEQHHHQGAAQEQVGQQRARERPGQQELSRQERVEQAGLAPAEHGQRDNSPNKQRRRVRVQGPVRGVVRIEPEQQQAETSSEQQRAHPFDVGPARGRRRRQPART